MIITADEDLSTHQIQKTTVHNMITDLQMCRLAGVIEWTASELARRRRLEEDKMKADRDWSYISY